MKRKKKQEKLKNKKEKKNSLKSEVDMNLRTDEWAWGKVKRNVEFDNDKSQDDI